MTQSLNLTNRIAGVAMLALAALPMAALATNAHAGAAVKVSDLNLLTADGQAQFEERVDVAASKYCVAERAIPNNRACRAGVRAELAEKVEAVRLAQLAKASQSFAAR